MANETDLKLVAASIKETDDEIDLVELFYALLSKWYQILLMIVVCMLLANSIAFFLVKPTYESTAKLYVVSSSGDSAVDLTDLNIGTSLTNDYRELIMSYPVLDQVIDELDLDMTVEEIEGMITLTNPTNTRVLSISVKTGDALLSAEIANTVAGVTQDYLPETMSTVRPNVAQVARAAENKSSPSFARYTIVGALIGFFLMTSIITVRYITDDTIRTPDDLEKAFDVSLLASIPDSEAFRSKEAMKKRKIMTREESTDEKDND